MPTRRRKPAKKVAKRRARTRTPASKKKHVPTKGLYGWITHTDIASTDPSATRAWCAKVLGWAFKPNLPMPEGEYHLFAYSAQGGGGIRPTEQGEMPVSVPYVHVDDARTAFDAAIREGAQEMMAPERVMQGVTIAVVRAPGGVVIGFSGP